MGKLLDEIYALVAVTVMHIIEVVIILATYAALIVGGWLLLGWLLFGG